MMKRIFLILGISLTCFAEEIEPQKEGQHGRIYTALGFNGGSGFDLALGCQYANGHHGFDVGASAGYLLVLLGTEAHADYLFFPQKEKHNFFLGAGISGGYTEMLFNPKGYYCGPHACIGSRFESIKGGGRFWKIGATYPLSSQFEEPFYNFSYGFLF
ncbi:MAG: hypothetical protein P0S96_02315 [Simkaniaceae bacterium]|nr:hypothetical protein [Candidatus Sacchlamyda saccharinae]